eukprot:TRINITY_DN25216_c0_g1_i1.p1 TRINITY_DN25216_c0_g1~~TRINITY_DN25216_c0_g1_i1.p1  ORF type:complete len:917 (+),score=263.93 TRINITY_DN25216_c0_g1_i1:73-2823(+)
MERSMASSGVRKQGAEGSVDINSSHYDARLAIKTELKDLPFEELKLELELHDARCQEDAAGMRALVAKHLDTFIKCKDAITELAQSEESRELFTRTVASEDQTTVAGLRREEERLRQRCDQVFAPLLSYEKAISGLQSVDQVCKKHETIFSMPETIRGHIERGEYDAVIKCHEFMRDQRRGLNPKTGGLGTALLAGLFDRVDEQLAELKQRLLRDLRDTPVSDTLRTEGLLSVLRRLRYSGLLARFTSSVSGRLSATLEAACKEFRNTICQLRDQLDKQAEFGYVASGLVSRTGSSFMGRWSTASQSVSALFGSSTQPQEETVEAGYEADLERGVSARGGIPQAQQHIENCGKDLAETLRSFWRSYDIVWNDRADSLCEWADEDDERHVVSLFEAACKAYRGAVWPVLERLYPDRSGATPQQWRAGLLSVAEKLTSVLDGTKSSDGCIDHQVELQRLKEEVQRCFFEQSIQRLSTEVSNWGRHMEWSTGFHLRQKDVLSTELPSRFKLALTDLLGLWAKEDDLSPDRSQRISIQRHFLGAHLAFLDLLHHLAFYDGGEGTGVAVPGGGEGSMSTADLLCVSQAIDGPLARHAPMGDPGGSPAGAASPADHCGSGRDRLLALLADTIAFKEVVVHDTYAAFRSWLDKGTVTGSPGAYSESPTGLQGSYRGSVPRGSPTARSSQGRRGSIGGMLAESSSGRSSPEPGHLKELQGLAKALQTRLVRQVMRGEMGRLSQIVCIDGFLRTDVDWHHAAEPRHVRKYVHQLLLHLVNLHEATVRMTGGSATAPVLQLAFDEVMTMLSHSTRRLDLSGITQHPDGHTAILNATLQIEIEVEFIDEAMRLYRRGHEGIKRGQETKQQLLGYLHQVHIPYMPKDDYPGRGQPDAAARRQAVKSRVKTTALNHSSALLSVLRGDDD